MRLRVSRLDGERNGWAAAKSVVAALRFAAAKLQFAILSATLASPIISSWLAKDKWTAKPAKEALPLPLHCVVSFERAVASCDCNERWLLLCFLLMLWGSLGWSDCQRVEIASTHLDDECHRCWVWRSKTSASGFPFGALTGGATSEQRGAELGKALLTLAKKRPAT